MTDGPAAKGPRSVGIKEHVGEIDPASLRQVVATGRHVGEGVRVLL